MRIAEIFHSIQGEGELTGVPSVFVRTSGCNLRCAWCDTKYASWNPEGEDVSISEVVARVCAFPGNHVVLTGGEPMVAAGIHGLAAELRLRGKHITIETAATIPPDGIACDLASLSPKLSNSTPHSGIEPTWINRHEAARWQPEVVRAWMEAYAFQLKFVLRDETDAAELEILLACLGRSIPPSKVLLMPEGIDISTLTARQDPLVGLCKERGYRYCPRLHIALFGNRRGT
jgi:7-carboxy-7-deazaguanine synthase